MVKETEEEMKEIDKLYKAGKKFIVRENGNFYAVLTERAKEQFEWSERVRRASNG